MPIILTNNFPPDFGGIQTYMLRLADEIHATGRCVIVIAPKGKGTDSYDRALPYKVIRYRRLTASPLGKFLELFTMCFALGKALSLSSDRESIASAWWPAGLALAIVPQQLRGRFIVIAHGMEIKPNVGGVRRILMRYAFRRSYAAVANSSFTRKLLETSGVQRHLTTIPCGVDEHSVPRRRSKQPTVLSVGRLVQRKGFDRMLEAVALLVPKFPDLQYEIVGNGPQLDELKQLCFTLQIADHVNFLGALSDEQMTAAYARAWCFALPGRRINDDVEGFGIVYLEAAMSQLPTIGGIDSGAIDAIESGRTGLLVNGEDALAISEALETLLRDRELSETMGRRGRERALREFRWPDITARILNALT